MSPWSIVIVLRTILFCVLANVVCGSQYYYWGNARTRNPRYASCPTCHRDCPDSLSSPWYSRQRYDEVSNRKPDGFDGGSYVQWPPSGSRIYPRNEYGRPTRSGGSNPTDVTAAGTGNSYRYENPFEDHQQLRRIDPYLASKLTASSLSEGNAPANSLNRRPFMPMTNSLLNRDAPRQSYQPKKYVVNSLDPSTYRENYRECSKDRSKALAFNENPYRDNGPIVGGSSVPMNIEKEDREGDQVGEEVEMDREEDYPKVSSEKYHVVYRADVDANSFEEPAEEDTSSLERSNFAGAFKESWIDLTSKDIDGGPFAGVDRRSFLEGYPEKEEFFDSRGHFGTSELIRDSEIKRNSYNLSPRSNLGGMTRNVERDTYSNREEDEEWSDEEIDRSLESLTGDNDYYDTTIAKESTKENIREDRLNNKDEKLQDESDESKVSETVDHEEEASLKFDPDLLDDIENPPVEPTEPTEPSPTSLPTESTIATEDRR